MTLANQCERIVRLLAGGRGTAIGVSGFFHLGNEDGIFWRKQEGGGRPVSKRLGGNSGSTQSGMLYYVERENLWMVVYGARGFKV